MATVPKIFFSPNDVQSEIMNGRKRWFCDDTDTDTDADDDFDDDVDLKISFN